MAAALVAGLAFLGAPPGGAAAQDTAARAGMPFAEVAPYLADGAVRVVALGSAGEADGPLAARRLSARTAARARALLLLHRWVDEALSNVPVSPVELRDAHAAVDSGIDLRRIRSLVDGSALVEIAVPLGLLRDAITREGLPW